MAHHTDRWSKSNLVDIAGEIRGETDLAILANRKIAALRELGMIRVLEKIEIDSNGCWNWKGYISSNGYGWASFLGRRDAAHRISYEFFVGPIGASLVIDHLCRNRKCINPKHLEAVSSLENLRRGIGIIAKQVARTECPSGHPLTAGNIDQHQWENYGRRSCRRCKNARARCYYAAAHTRGQ